MHSGRFNLHSTIYNSDPYLSVLRDIQSEIMCEKYVEFNHDNTIRIRFMEIIHFEMIIRMRSATNVVEHTHKAPTKFNAIILYLQM